MAESPQHSRIQWGGKRNGEKAAALASAVRRQSRKYSSILLVIEPNLEARDISWSAREQVRYAFGNENIKLQMRGTNIVLLMY